MTSKPKLNQPDVESTITSPIGESLNINFTIPSKQFEQVFEKDTNIEKRNITLEEVKKRVGSVGGVDVMNENIKKYLKEKNIPFQYINNKLRLYFQDIGTKEIEIDIKRKNYGIGITTTDKINMKEHNILSNIFEMLGWL